MGFVVLILAFPFLIFKLIFEKSEDNNSSPTPTEIEKETKDEKTVNETTTTKYVGVANNNAVDEKSKQTQSSDSLSQEDDKTLDELLEIFEKEDNQELLEQDGLSEEDKEVLTKAQDVIGVYLGRSDNLTDTIKDIDNWLDRQQVLIDNDVFDKEELAVYNDILSLRQRLGNQLQTQKQDNNSVNS